MTYPDIKFEKIEIKPKPDSYYRQHWWQFWKPKKFDWTKWTIEEPTKVISWHHDGVEELLKEELMKNINASKN